MPILRLVILMFCSMSAWASMPTALQPTTIELASGDVYSVSLMGSRDDPYLRLDDGRLLVEVNSTLFLAKLDRSGKVVALPTEFGRLASAPEASNGPQISVTPKANATISAAAPQHQPYRYAGGTHKQPLVIVRVNFANQSSTYSDAEFAERVFGSNTNSVRDYFLENSYGQFDIEPVAEQSGTRDDGIITMTLTTDHPDFGNQYGSSSQALVATALSYVASVVNLTAYDLNGDTWIDPNEVAVVLLVSGFEQAYAGTASSHPRIWAHKSSVTAVNSGGVWLSEYAMFGEQHERHMATTGLISHELGHLLFDLPDLYDYLGIGDGIGRWGLMSYGGWNSGGGDAGDFPSHMMAWNKLLAGFAEETVVTTGGGILDALAISPDIIEIPLDAYRHGKRLLLEHRYQTGFDVSVPDEGLLISQIDDNFGFGPLASLTTDVADQLVLLPTFEQSDSLVLGSSKQVMKSASGYQLYSDSRGAVTLASLSTNTSASVSVTSSIDIHGDNIGYDELPPNGLWGSYGGSGSMAMPIALSSSVTSVDGIDWFAHGPGEVTVGLYRNFDVWSPDGEVVRQNYSVKAGWNRLLFSSAKKVSAGTLYLQVDSVTNGSHAPILADTQGMASGLTYVRSNSSSPFTVAPFDVSVRVLVSVSDLGADAMAPNLPVIDASSSSSSSSGGGAWVWLLLIVFLPRQRLYCRV